MYAKLAQSVESCSDAQQFSTSVKEIKTKLVERVPSEEAFRVGFSALRYASDFTRDRALIRYILRKLSEHHGLASEVDGSLYTVEHITAESTANDQTWASIASIGNMLFVPEAINGDLGTKPFGQKLKIIKDAHIPVDDKLGKATKWGIDEIDERTDELAELAFSKIWAL